MKVEKTVTKLIASLLVLLMSAPYAYCADIGRVAYTEGRVDLIRVGTEQAVPAIEGDLVFVGDSVRTKSNSKAEVSFNDKSLIRLAQNTRVDLKDYQLTEDNKRKTATVLIERGKARTIIAKMADLAEFNIHTPNAQGKVKGSDVTAFYQAGSSGMLVTEGNLSICNTAHPETKIIIPAGSSVSIPQEESPKGPRPILEIEKKIHEGDTFVPDKPVRREGQAQIKGAISKMSGEVRLTKKGDDKSRLATMNDILDVGDRINTGSNGVVEIRLDNGNVINLKPETDFLFITMSMDPTTGEYDNTFESGYGKVMARIEGLKGKSQFRVKTPTAISGARGTIMYLEIKPTSTKSFFEGGVGYMKNMISGLEKAIDVGQNSKADDAGGVSEPVPTSDEDRMEWSSGWEAGSGVEGYSSPEGGTGIELSLSDDGGGAITSELNLGIGNNRLDPDIRPDPVEKPDEGEDETVVLEAQNSATGDIYNSMFNNNGYLGSFGGIFALVRTFWQDGDSADFLSVGELMKEGEDADLNRFIWYSDEGAVFSNDPATDNHMTFDGGAFYGVTSGIGGNLNGIDALDGFMRLLYIDPDGKAGAAKGDLIGLFSEEFSDYLLLGEISRSESLNGIDTGIAPSMLYDSIYWSRRGDGDLEGAGFYGEGQSYGISGYDNLWTLSIADFDNGPVQQWGIYQQLFYDGSFEGNVPDDWTAMMGGKNDAFAGIQAYITTYGSYTYVNESDIVTGGYFYNYYSNPVNGYLAYADYYVPADGSGWWSYYYPDGRRYTYDRKTGEYSWDTWDTSRPISEFVDNPPEGNYSLAYSGSFKGGRDDQGFWIADITGNSWNDGVFSASLSGRFLTRYKMGRIDGNILGVFGFDENSGIDGQPVAGWWKAAGSGEWEGDTLTLSGLWGDEYGGEYSIYENDEGDMDRVGEDAGYIGSLTASWWSKRMFPYVAMGEHDLDGSDVSESSFIWDSPIDSFNVLTNDNTTLDGGYFTGYSAGIIDRGSMRGDSVAIFVDPSEKAGIMTGGVFGNMYGAVEMWSLDGVFMPDQLASLDLEGGFSSEYIRSSYLTAEVESEGEYGPSYVEGEDDFGQTRFIEGQSWGIYNLRLGDENEYTRPVESRVWGGNIYGEGVFGGGMKPTLGIMSGNVYGLFYDDYFWYDDDEEERDYADGYWVASSVGTFKSRAVSTEEESEGYQDNGAYFGYIGTLLTEDGLMIGKMAALFAGSLSESIMGDDLRDDMITESRLGLVMGGGSFMDGGEDAGDIEVDASSFDGTAAGFRDMDWGIWAAKFNADQSDPSNLFALTLIGESIRDYDGEGGGDQDGMWVALVPGIRVPGSDLLKGLLRGILVSGDDDYIHASLLTGDMLGILNDDDRFEAIAIGEWRNMGSVDYNLVEGVEDTGGFLELISEGYFSGAGNGSFDNGQPMELLNVDGMTLDFQDQKWGIWAAFFNGTCPEPGTIFNVAFGGTTDDEYSESYDRYMIGTIRGYREGDELTAFLNGLALGTSDYDDSKISAYAMTGNANGYIEVDETTTWNAAAAGEWVEVTDLLDPSKLGFDAAGLADFVSVPITEIYSATNLVGTGSFSGGGGTITGVMDINLYASSSAVLNQVWTALISGTYSGPTSSVWTLDLATPQGDAARLAGTQWSEGGWVADVTGTTATGATFNGQAGGTYTNADESGNGTFSGAGAGTWQAPS